MHRRSLFLPLLLLVSAGAWAVESAQSNPVADIAQRWAQIQYETPEKLKAEEFEKLAAQSDALTQAQSNAAEAWIWYGIVLSSWAGAKGGFGALGKAKEARVALQKSLEIDPTALDGSGYTSLGALYDEVPGWPIGFGDSHEAEKLLRKALDLNPSGIDTLYFWGDHLYRQDRYADARDTLLKAKRAAPRPGRELADAGRRKEIDALLANVEKKLN
jgi:tetratricopeptide (TPR) repeat protein